MASKPQFDELCKQNLKVACDSDTDNDNDITADREFMEARTFPRKFTCRCSDCKKICILIAYETEHGCLFCEACTTNICLYAPDNGKDNAMTTCVVCQKQFVIKELRAPSASYKERFSTTEFQCLNSKDGCKETMLFHSLKIHYESNCPYSKLTCDLCNNEYRRMDLEEHKRSECRMRLVSCQLCGLKVPEYSLRNHDHLNNCTEMQKLSMKMRNQIQKEYEKSAKQKTKIILLSMLLLLISIACHHPVVPTELMESYMYMRHNVLGSLLEQSLFTRHVYQRFFGDDFGKVVEEENVRMFRIPQQLSKVLMSNLVETSDNTRHILDENHNLIVELNYSKVRNEYDAVTTKSFVINVTDGQYFGQLQFYTNGNGFGAGTDLAVFMRLCAGSGDYKNSWPFKHSLAIDAVDPEGNILSTFLFDYVQDKHGFPGAFVRPTRNKCNRHLGSRKILPLAEIRHLSSLSNGALFFRIRLLDGKVWHGLSQVPIPEFSEESSLITSTSLHDSPKKILIFNISNLSEKEKLVSRLNSETFYTHRHGYGLHLSVFLLKFLNGSGTLEVFIEICAGRFDSQLEWPFPLDLAFGIYNSTLGNIKDPALVSVRRDGVIYPMTFRRPTSGCVSMPRKVEMSRGDIAVNADSLSVAVMLLVNEIKRSPKTADFAEKAFVTSHTL